MCLRGNAIHSYVIHANYKNYAWDMTREWDWRKQPETDESFLRHGYHSTVLHVLRGTLTNYFDHPFGSVEQIGAFKIQTEAAKFTFAKDAPKVISVGIHFLPQEGSARLLDLGNSLDFWVIRVVTPTRERAYRDAKGHESIVKDPKAKQVYRARKDLVNVDVRNGNLTSGPLILIGYLIFPNPVCTKCTYRMRAVGLPTDGERTNGREALADRFSRSRFADRASASKRSQTIRLRLVIGSQNVVEFDRGTQPSHTPRYRSVPSGVAGRLRGW